MDLERPEPDILEAPVEPLEGPAERREEEEPVDVSPPARPAPLQPQTPRTAKLRKAEFHLDSERELRETSSEKGLETRAVVARTALVIPLSTPGEEEGPICLSADQTRRRVESYLERRVVNTEGELAAMWRVQELPREVHDLSPHFRQLLGYVDHREAGGHLRIRSWRTYRLKLRKEIRSMLFADATLWSYDLEGSPVKLIIFPLGTPIFSIKIDWFPDAGLELSLAQVRTRIYVSKFRAKVSRVNSGWTFTPAVPPTHRSSAFQSHIASLGAALSNAIYEGVPISLGDFAEALCASKRSDEIGSSKPRERHCFHHSVVLLAAPLPDDTLYSSLFHLRRAYGQKNRPPPPPSRHALDSYDRVLIPRGNRYIGISREGNICLTWLDGSANAKLEPTSAQVFETQIWPHKWMGIYFVLSIHALGERESLEEISFLTALEADDITLMPDEASLSQTKEARFRLRSLAAVLIRFTLSMSSSDCGGLSEYSEYFRALRDCFGIAERRAELDDEISHVQGMVDAYYMQEKRREETRKIEARAISQRYLDKLQRLDDRYRQRVDLFVALLTSLALPLAVASSMWGMNNSDLPKVPWWSVIVGALIASAILFLGVSIVLIRRRLAYERYSSKLKKKLKQKLEQNNEGELRRDERRGSASSMFGSYAAPRHHTILVEPVHG